MPTIEKNLRSDIHINQQKSWATLKPHAEVCSLLAKSAASRVAGDLEGAASRWADLEAYLCENELLLQDTFDFFEFVYAFKRNGFADTALDLM